MKRYRLLGLALAPLLLLAPVAPAQQLDTALIVGTVTDASGAVIPGVSLTFSHLSTGTAYVSSTNAEGNYRSNPLRIGEYIVIAEGDGFSTYSGSGISLSIGDVRQLDIVLEVGAVTEIIEVEASAPLLQTSEAAAGTVIENRQIVDLPLNGRDYLQLAVISSGTVMSRGQGVSIGGQRGTEVNFVIDGMDNNNQSIASQGNQKEAVKPSIDAIAEFKVITNGFAAEYGRTSAGIVSLSIKSGTNELHGTGFGFFRDEAMDARNFFAPSGDKPAFGRRQYGFALGGPIKRNRAFLFGDMELTDVRESTTFVSTVPTAAVKRGDFTGADTVYDPLTWDGTERQPFPGNMIPESRVDRVTSVMRDWYPDPQNDARTRNYTYVTPRNQDFHKFDVRYDQNLTASDNFFARWSSQEQNRGSTPRYPAIPDFGSMSRGGLVNVTSNNAVVSYQKVWSPTLITAFRTGWNYLDTDVESHLDITENINAKLGIPGFNQHLRGTNEMNLTGYSQLGNNTFRPNLIQSQTRQASADTTFTSGNHAIKFGLQSWWLQSFIDNPQRTMGTIWYDGRFTERSPTDRAGTGDAMGDFLLGSPREFGASNTVYMNMRTNFLHFYVQDDWRVNERLTLNLGLRYELNPPYVETRDGIANFNLGTCRGCDDGFIHVAGLNGDDHFNRALMTTDKTNFAPRFGLAYKITDKTVLRFAYGLFYGNMSNTGGGEFMETMPPFHIKSSLVTGRVDPFLKHSDGLPPGTISPRNAQGVEMSSFEFDPQWPLAQNWNFNLQFSLPGDSLWEIGYFGNKMNHMIGRYDENLPRPGPGSPNSRRPWSRTEIPASCRDELCFDGTDPGGFITLGRMNRHAFRENTLYHGLQTKLEKRYSKGVTYILSYAWSHVIGDARGVTGSGDAPGSNLRFVLDPLDWKRERGNGAQDMRHRFIGSFVYELPFGRGKRFGAGWGSGLSAVLGDWSVGSIVSLTSGTPQHLTVAGNPANVGGGDRPNVVPGVDWELSDPDPSGFYNPDAFVPNDPFTFGNAGKNILVGPGLVGWDFSLYKNIRFSEKYGLQFRAEAFNFPNHPNFNFPNAQVGNRNFGVISSARAPRIMQIGLKFVF